MAGCPSCGQADQTGRFCEACGTALPQTCPICGASASPDAHFCGSCGANLEGAPHPAEGERRQVAALFCDVVGSTRISQRMDVEAFSDLMFDVQRLAAAAVTVFGGAVGSYAGDGIVAWFGWPQAHEDDTALAVEAGLRILDDLDELNKRVEPSHGLRLNLRVAVHVGPVVLRTDREDAPLFGEMPSVASRLEAFAEPDTLVISDTAYSLVRGRFAAEFLGTPELKGVERPIGVYRVDRHHRTVGQPARPADDAPFVGREIELQNLVDAWRSTARGIGRTVVVSGEPGVGKTRLLTALKAELRDAPHRVLELRCSPLTRNTAFRPVADMVARGLGIPDTEGPHERRRMLREALRPEMAHAEKLIAALLGLETEDLPPPEAFRRQLMDALHIWLLSVAREQPVLIAGEDVHWADASTLELVRQLQDTLAAAPVMIVLTRRPEGELGLAGATEITLDRLQPDEAARLARHLANAKGLPLDVADRAAERSDGVPLFVEALVAAAGEGDESGLPTSLQSALLARLDRLGPAREIAQVAAVLGRSFQEPVLAAAAERPRPAVVGALAQLISAGLIASRASADGLVYEFRHALIRDAAYESLLKRRRSDLHRHVAAVLEEQFPDRVARDPELLGHHLSNGGQLLPAALAFEQAGRRAARSASLNEAAAHYRHGIELLKDVPSSRERDRAEMWLGILLGNALMGSEGHGAATLKPVWERAIELGEEVGDADELTAALNGLAVQQADNAELDAAIALAQRQLELGSETGSRHSRLRGHGTMGLALFYRGRPREALAHFEASIDCYRDGDFQALTFGVGHDQGIFARGMTAWAQWLIGRPDESLKTAEDAVARAEQLGSFLSLAMARHFLALAHQLRRESEAALKQAQLNVAFAHELGFRFWEGVALVAAGTERTRCGDSDGLQDIQRGIGLLKDAGSRSGTTSGLGTLSEALHASGDTRAALATVDSALQLSETLGQSYWDAELLRLKAQFVLELDAGAGPAAHDLLMRALDDARARGAAGPALRAATDLARLQAAAARHEEARDTVHSALADVEGGEDTADVRAAHALLDSIPHPVTTKEMR